jgi:hypothetical protein
MRFFIGMGGGEEIFSGFFLIKIRLFCLTVDKV